MPSQWNFANDPFPDIPPALLNSADIQAYQDACNLIRNEAFSLDRLKSASYEVRFKGDVYWWEEGGEGGLLGLLGVLGLVRRILGTRRHQRIEDDQPFQIKKNQIVYVSPDAEFALPDFIALRFNLRINLVHRGLLLGTGPLVDPGFEGRLLIPLHNLTSQDIEVNAKDGFIWVEFTKISPLTSPNTKASVRKGKQYNFVEFRENKKKLTAFDYFEGAGGGPFKSSLAELLVAATEAEKTIKRYSLFGAVTLVVAIVALVFSAWQFWMQSAATIRDANQWVQDSKQEVAKVSAENREATNALKARLDTLESKFAKSAPRNSVPKSGANKAGPQPTK